MPITMRWADERKKLFIFDLHAGDWTWRQYDLAVDEAFNLVGIEEHDFAAIILSAPAMPEGNPMTHFARVGRIQPHHLKLYVIVSRNPFIRTLNGILARMYPKVRIIFANSGREAVILAAEHGYQADIDPDSLNI